MRSLLPQTVVFTTAGLLAGCMPIHAQQADTTVGPEIQYQSHCARTSRSYDAQPSGAEVSIDNVTFSGFHQMPISDQEEIATSISQETHAYPLDGLIEEALERVRLGWQDRGYFNVAVSGDTRTLAKNAADVHIALFVHVDEGPRYTLGGITFKHNKSLADVKRLRALFPINDGEVFSREKIAKGLENLQKAYGEFGFANYTGVPATTFDDEQKVAFLRIDVDEGRQFIVGSINILGLDDLAQRALLKDAPIGIGQIYNRRLDELFLLRHNSLFPDCECRTPERLGMDEKAGTLALTFDARPCLTE